MKPKTKVLSKLKDVASRPPAPACYAALVRLWRACAKSQASKAKRIKGRLPVLADKLESRSDVYSECAEQLEAQMRDNEKAEGPAQQLKRYL